MTRPPDFDLTTVEGIVRTVEAMGLAGNQAWRFALWSGSFRTPLTADEHACQYATVAAHHARRLQGVAEASARVVTLEQSVNRMAERFLELGHPCESLGALLTAADAKVRVTVPTRKPCPDCHGTGTSGERAEDGAPLVCTACQGGRR